MSSNISAATFLVQVLNQQRNRMQAQPRVKLGVVKRQRGQAVEKVDD